MYDMPGTPELDTPRPDHACVLCPPPKTNAWWLADPGYRTCSDCYDKLREQLLDIGKRYRRLDPTPGATGDGGHRGAPGFGSRPPASPHIITMTDWRSKSCEVAVDGVLYVWDWNADSTLEPGQLGPTAGAYTERREVWFGRDGRGHTEQENPPRSIPLALSSLAAMVAEDRDMTPPASRDVGDLVRWLDGQMDWITRNDVATYLHDEFRSLLRQLRPVTGDPAPSRFGACPNPINEETLCGAPLRTPSPGSDTITCTSCQRQWKRPDWEGLGQAIQQQRIETLRAS